MIGNIFDMPFGSYKAIFFNIKTSIEKFINGKDDCDIFGQLQLYN